MLKPSSISYQIFLTSLLNGFQWPLLREYLRMSHYFHRLVAIFLTIMYVPFLNPCKYPYIPAYPCKGDSISIIRRIESQSKICVRVVVQLSLRSLPLHLTTHTLSHKPSFILIIITTILTQFLL